MMANDMLELFIKERKGVSTVTDEFGGTGMLTPRRCSRRYWVKLKINTT